MYASFENVKESGLSVGRRVGRRLSCRRLKDAQNRLFTGSLCEYGGKKAAAP